MSRSPALLQPIGLLSNRGRKMLLTPGLSLATWPEPIRESASHSWGLGRACCKGEGGERKKKKKVEERCWEGKGKRQTKRHKQTNRQSDGSCCLGEKPENVIPTLLNGAVTPKNKSIEQKAFPLTSTVRTIVVVVCLSVCLFAIVQP